MLYRLEIENFYSIRDRQVIDLLAAANAPELSHRLAPAWLGSKQRVPRVVALFGANASGKSNVLKALAFVAWFVKDSFSFTPDTRLPFERFNETSMLEAPARLAVHLSGISDPDRFEDPEAPQCPYAYEVLLGGPSTEVQRVIGESLYYWPSEDGRKTRLFERDASGKVLAAKAFGLAGFHQALEKVLRPSVSVISTLAQLQHPFSMAIRNTASRVAANIFIEKQDGGEDQTVRYYAENPKAVELLNKEIERIDLGLNSMQIVQGSAGHIAMFEHKGLSRPMPLLYESHGTRQFVRLYPFIFYALETGGLAVLDELDAAIHPLVLPEMLRWFYDPKRNPHDAQLWITCQNASLLEELTKEEVLFCEKNSHGQTHVYGLRDIQAVRRDDNYYKKYLGGVYGAVPQIG